MPILTIFASILLLPKFHFHLHSMSLLPPYCFCLNIALCTVSQLGEFSLWGGIQLLRGELESTTIDHKNNGENVTIFSNDLMSNDGS